MTFTTAERLCSEYRVQEKGRSHSRTSLKSSGADRDRTDDLFHAMEALSQLSYGPRNPTGGLALASMTAGERRKVSERPPTGKPWLSQTRERVTRRLFYQRRLEFLFDQPSNSSIAPAKTSLPWSPTNLLTTSPSLRRITVGID